MNYSQLSSFFEIAVYCGFLDHKFLPVKELKSGRMLQEDSKRVIKGTVYRLMNRKMMKRVGKGKYMMK